jgi:hypothetical protein
MAVLVAERHSSGVRDLRETPEDELAVLAGKARDQRARRRDFLSRESFIAVLWSGDLVDELGDPLLQFKSACGDRDFRNLPRRGRRRTGGSRFGGGGSIRIGEHRQCDREGQDSKRPVTPLRADHLAMSLAMLRAI